MNPFNREIKNYVLKMKDELNHNYKGIMTDKQASKIISIYENSQDTYESIIKKINILKDQMIEEYLVQCNDCQKFIDNILNQKSIQCLDKEFFGQQLNYQLVRLFEEYEKIENDDNYKEEEKILKFEESKNSYINYLISKKENIIVGIKELGYDTIKKLYTNFINDIDIISLEEETKMSNMIRTDLPLLNEDNTINEKIYNFEKAEIGYDFAKKHNKKMKFPHLVDEFPTVLKEALVTIPPELHKKIVIEFLDNYMKNIYTWYINKNYNFKQIDVINNVASDNPNTQASLKNNYWVKIIGRNYQNKINYIIDILKLARKNFNNCELLYTENNEYLEYKCEKIFKIIYAIQIIEQQTKNKLLDGIGLSSSYTEKSINQSNIFNSMIKFSRLDVPMYRTNLLINEEEIDEQLLSAIISADKICDIRGVILDKNNNSTKLYDEYKNLYSKLKRKQLIASIKEKNSKTLSKK